VDLRLPAAGGSLTLYDRSGAVLDRVSYPLQDEGVSFGRLPDGADGTWRAFPGPTPGISNAPVAHPPVLETVSFSAGMLRVRVQADLGFDYEFQVSADLDRWDTVAVEHPTATPFDWSLAADGTPSQFLRVRVRP
jgi:hypothetical protein